MKHFFLVIIALIGCTETPEITEACRRMCRSATALYGDCLETWGMTWSDAGYSHASSHQESCEVWSWEVAELHGRNVSDGLCLDRGEIFRMGECSDYTDINWNEIP